MPFQPQDIVCINLAIRPQKRKWMQQQARNRKIKLHFYTAQLHSNPARGCLESHLNVIKDAKKRGLSTILILEDDAKFIKSLNSIPTIPEKWDMLYLGGMVKTNVIETEDESHKHPGWDRVSTWTTHAYILNLKNEEMIAKILNEMPETDEPIDEWFIRHLHHQYKVYIINPMLVIQREGFSDIDGEEKWNNHLWQNIKYDQPDYQVEGDNYILKLPKLEDDNFPYVSILTPTRNRRNMFALAVRNFLEFDYPHEKLEWVIVDDGIEDIHDLLPQGKKGKNIKYIRLDIGQKENPQARLPIGKKRNLCVQHASHKYLVHMDDDDYYPPTSIIARVKLLIKYGKESDYIRNNNNNNKNKEQIYHSSIAKRCLGSVRNGVYDLMHNQSSVSSDSDDSLSEASMAYTRSFWEDRPWCETDVSGENRYFLTDRSQEVLDVPYSFIMISITHINNLTGNLRRSDGIGRSIDNNFNFMDDWDIETKVFMLDLRKYLEQKQKLFGKINFCATSSNS